MLTDVYVLAPERSAALVARFLDRFVPNREPSAADYPVPQYGDNPSMVLASPDEVWSAPLVLRYKSSDPRDLRRLQPGQHVGALFHAEGTPDVVTELLARDITAYSFEYFQDDDGTFPLMAAVQEICDRTALATGKSLGPTRDGSSRRGRKSHRAAHRRTG